MSNLNPIIEAFKANYRAPKYIAMPQPPRTESPVPWLTSLYHDQYAGNFGNRNYPGNCSGNLIRDLLFYFQPESVADLMTGGGTCADVCKALGIKAVSADLKTGFDVADEKHVAGLNERFDFVWLHPPYWRMIQYSNDPRDFSTQPTLAAFRDKLKAAIANCLHVLNPGGKIVILMGDYNDRELGFVPLTQLTKNVCSSLGLRQACTDIIRFSHGAGSSGRRYRSSFIPGLHDVCTIFERMEEAVEQRVAA